VPKAWSKQEKEKVKAVLKKVGKRLFEKFGLKKTTVDDIVQAAKISKGAFYHFYQSKEELYFEIVEELEKENKTKIFSRLSQPGKSIRESFRSFLNELFAMMTENPIYSQLSNTDYEYLLRKLPEETVNAHVKRDFAQFASHFAVWMEEGYMRKVSLEALSGLMLTLFYFIMHREEFDIIDYNGAKQLWIDMLTDYLIPAK
jgi:AcrR family transcriptional regulator